MNKNKQNSQSVTVFHDYPLPETKAKPVGYIALIADYDLAVPLPDSLCAIKPGTGVLLVEERGPKRTSAQMTTPELISTQVSLKLGSTNGSIITTCLAPPRRV